MSALLLLGAAVAGMALVFGLVFTAQLQKQCGPVGATLINFCVGALIMAVTFTVQGQAMPSDLGDLPAWSYLGGAAGALYVTLNLIATKTNGLATTTVAIILGQMLMSRLIDQFGWLGVTARPITAPQLIGTTFLILAVYLVQHERR